MVTAAKTGGARATVANYLRLNPTATVGDVCKATGVAQNVVSRVRNAMEAELAKIVNEHVAGGNGRTVATLSTAADRPAATITGQVLATVEIAPGMYFHLCAAKVELNDAARAQMRELLDIALR